MNSANRVNTSSRTPPASPALTMFTKRLSKTRGYNARDSENVEPLSTAPPRPSSDSRNCGFFSCFSRILSPLSKGTPASIRVASCRVITMSCFGLTLPRRKPGSLSSMLSPEARGAAMLRATAPPPPPPISVTRVGKKPFERIAARAWDWFSASRTPSVSPPLESIATYLNLGMAVLRTSSSDDTARPKGRQGHIPPHPDTNPPSNPLIPIAAALMVTSHRLTP